MKNEQELAKRETAMKIAEDPDSFATEIRDKKREEMIESRKQQYAPMIEAINENKEERLRLHTINNHNTHLHRNNEH